MMLAKVRGSKCGEPRGSFWQYGSPTWEDHCGSWSSRIRDPLGDHPSIDKGSEPVAREWEYVASPDLIHIRARCHTGQPMNSNAHQVVHGAA
jgi:hypothetical protein